MKLNRIDAFEPDNNSQPLIIDEQVDKAIIGRRQTFDLHWQSSQSLNSQSKPDQIEQTDVVHQPFNLIF